MHSFQSSFLACLLWLQAGQSRAQASPEPRDTITIATELFTVNPTHVVFYSTETILPGSSAVSIDGQPVSADLNNDLLINGTTVITGTSSVTLTSTNSGKYFRVPTDEAYTIGANLT